MVAASTPLMVLTALTALIMPTVLTELTVLFLGDQRVCYASRALLTTAVAY